MSHNIHSGRLLPQETSAVLSIVCYRQLFEQTGVFHYFLGSICICISGRCESGGAQLRFTCTDSQHSRSRAMVFDFILTTAFPASVPAAAATDISSSVESGIPPDVGRRENMTKKTTTAAINPPMKLRRLTAARRRASRTLRRRRGRCDVFLGVFRSTDIMNQAI